MRRWRRQSGYRPFGDRSGCVAATVIFHTQGHGHGKNLEATVTDDQIRRLAQWQNGPMLDIPDTPSIPAPVI